MPNLHFHLSQAPLFHTVAHHLNVFSYFQQGQGLGRDEQGMSMALSVEKTSKRGGRIVHEKDLMMPPPPQLPGAGLGASDNTGTPPPTEDRTATPPIGPVQPEKPSITDLMKNPSKVVLCKVRGGSSRTEVIRDTKVSF